MNIKKLNNGNYLVNGHELNANVINQALAMTNKFTTEQLIRLSIHFIASNIDSADEGIIISNNVCTICAMDEILIETTHLDNSLELCRDCVTASHDRYVIDEDLYEV